MADVKITALPASGVPAAADVFPVVDVSAGPTTEQVTLAQIGEGIAALTVTAPSACTAAAGAVGTSIEMAHADHTHQISAGNPSFLGIAKDPGVATDFARSDHEHPAQPNIVTESGTTRTLADSDHHTIILCTNAAGCAITVPNGLTAGLSVEFVQRGAAAVTFTNGGGAVTFEALPRAAVPPATDGLEAVVKLFMMSTSEALMSGGLAQTDMPAYGEIYLTSAASTTIATVSTPVKAAGTTALGPDATWVDFDMPANNRLRYTGAETKVAHVAMSFSATSPGNNKTYNFYAALNGTVLASSVVRLQITTGANVQTSAIHVAVEMAQNDYLEIWIENITDNTDATLETLNLFAMMMKIP